MRFFQCLLLLTGLLFSADAINSDKEIQFLSGFLLLQSKTNLEEPMKVQKFQELLTITGLSAQDAINFIQSYRNDPEKWKKVLLSANNSIKSGDSSLIRIKGGK